MCSVVKESLTSTAVKQAEQTGLSFGSSNILRYVYYISLNLNADMFLEFSDYKVVPKSWYSFLATLLFMSRITDL